MIYGVALLAACSFIGGFLGNILGLLTGLNSDIGGVGFSMLLLLILTNSKFIAKIFPKDYEKGLEFWKSMFIPIIIAMSASQNVYNAVSGGWLALTAGLVTVLIAFLLIPVFNLLASDKSDPKENTKETGQSAVNETEVK